MKALLQRLCFWEDLAVRCLVLDSPRSYRVCLALLAGIVAVLAGLVFATGCSHQARDPVDYSVVLDGVWRLSNGQRPHHDFFSIIGAVPLLVLRLGTLFGGQNVNALAYGVGALFPFFTLWGWVVAKRRFSAPVALGFALLCGTLLIATVPLGYHTDIRIPSYEMHYNRVGWALFCLLLATVGTPPRQPLGRRDLRIEGFVTGLVLAALVFTKINYLVMGVAGLGMGLVLVPSSRRLIPSIAAGGAVTSLLLLAYLHFDLVAFCRDLRTLMGRVQDPAENFQVLRWLLSQNLLALGLLAAAFALLASRWLRVAAGTGKWSAAFPLALLVGCSILGLGIFTCRGNTQSYQIPLFAVAGLIVCESYRRDLVGQIGGGVPEGRDQLRFLFANGISLTLLAGLLTQDSASLASSCAWKYMRANTAPLPCRIDVKPLKDMALPWWPGEKEKSPSAFEQGILERAPEWHSWTPAQYACAISDGIELLRPFCLPGNRLLVLDCVDPFSFALQIPPPRGVPICWDGSIENAAHCPKPAVLFQDVTLVMIPKGPQCKPDYDFLMRQYGPVVKSDFQLAAESRLWSVYVRPTPAAGTTTP
jgi:hypothetical protein